MLKVDRDERPGAQAVREIATFIALKSLLRTALRAMIEWNRVLRVSGPGRVWEDTWKLWAWGEAIGINKAGLAGKTFSSAMGSHGTTPNKLVRNLKLINQYVSTQLHDKRRPERRPSVNDTDSTPTYTEEAQKINDCIKNLRNALPERYQTMVERQKGYYGEFAKTDPPGLPSLLDEAPPVI